MMIAATIEYGKVRPSEHPTPQPGTGEVLIRVRAAGLNGADIMQVAGNYPAPPTIPITRSPSSKRVASGPHSATA